MNQPTNPDKITEDQRLRIFQAINRMPYGGMVMHAAPRSPEQVDPEAIVKYLGVLAEALTHVSAANEATTRERHELLNQRDAVRAFFGTDDL
jgi:hypothetical protein